MVREKEVVHTGSGGTGGTDPADALNMMSPPPGFGGSGATGPFGAPLLRRPSTDMGIGAPSSAGGVRARDFEYFVGRGSEVVDERVARGGRPFFTPTEPDGSNIRRS